jgi:hypothetical protein
MMSKRFKTKKFKTKKKLNKIDGIERDRLGSSGVVNTRHFCTRQTFGPASKVRHISPEEYLQ